MHGPVQLQAVLCGAGRVNKEWKDFFLKAKREGYRSQRLSDYPRGEKPTDGGPVGFPNRRYKWTDSVIKWTDHGYRKQPHGMTRSVQSGRTAIH